MDIKQYFNIIGEIRNVRSRLSEAEARATDAFLRDTAHMDDEEFIREIVRYFGKSMAMGIYREKHGGTLVECRAIIDAVVVEESPLN